MVVAQRRETYVRMLYSLKQWCCESETTRAAVVSRHAPRHPRLRPRPRRRPLPRPNRRRSQQGPISLDK